MSQSRQVGCAPPTTPPMPALDPLPPVMTPVASAPADSLATPELHRAYLAAQVALEAHLDTRDALVALYTRIAQAEAVLRRRRLVAWSSAAARARVQRQERRLFELEMERVELESRAGRSLSDVLLPVGTPSSPSFRDLLWAFQGLTRSGRVWDVTGYVDGMPFSKRTVARTPVALRMGRLDTVRPDLDAPCFENANGPALWLYPTLLALQRRAHLPALVDLHEVTVQWEAVTVYETSQPPADADWALLTYDERLWVVAESPGVPAGKVPSTPHFLAKYAFLRFTTERGLREAYLISSRTRAQEFASRFRHHQHRLRNGRA